GLFNVAGASCSRSRRSNRELEVPATLEFMARKNSESILLHWLETEAGCRPKIGVHVWPVAGASCSRHSNRELEVPATFGSHVAGASCSRRSNRELEVPATFVSHVAGASCSRHSNRELEVPATALALDASG
ncbi:MAG: hypothetical protein KAX37_03995, partial [Opitutaceae bacterium]|nr:hypothetical protein [Opitutaceae bacterium]